MSTFWAASLSYTVDQVIAVRVTATNQNGQGLASSASTSSAVVQTISAAMAPPTRGEGTSETSIQVDWLAQTVHVQSGGSAILSYNL
jgi:hypothetical protein